MIRLSASLIKDFLSCSKRAHYRLYSPEQSVSTGDMIVGTIVHKVIEEMPFDDMDEGLKYAQILLTSYNITEQSLLDKTKVCLRNYYSNFSTLITKHDLVEKFFSVKYIKDSNIVGKFDRISDNRIIDWKTGYNIPKSIDSDIQFIIYYVSYMKLYGKEPENVLFVSLYKNKLVEFHPNSLYINELYGKVIPDLVDSINKKKFVRSGLYTNACKDCSFISICYKELEGE